MMKKLLGILILMLIWCSTLYADDISEFEIEGMSIGDSALDFKYSLSDKPDPRLP